MEAYFLGFDPNTLEERFDVLAAHTRLEELADRRGLEETIEKIGLYKAIGRLEDAAEAASTSLRQARLNGDRDAIMRIRIAQARVQRAEGRLEHCVAALSDVILEAQAHGRQDFVADALRQRAISRFALEDAAGAREDLNEALAVLVRDNASPREIDTTMIAVGRLLDRTRS